MNTTYYVQNVNNITEALWIQSVNCDNQQFQRYQQKEQSATISSHLKLLLNYVLNVRHMYTYNG
jgi:hypothetical protein